MYSNSFHKFFRKIIPKLTEALNDTFVELTFEVLIIYLRQILFEVRNFLKIDTEPF